MDSYRAIENLIYDSMWMIDNEQEEAMIRTLHKDCVHITPPGMNEMPAINQAEWASKVHRRWGPDRRNRTKHIVSNIRIEVDEQAGTASARTYLTIVQGVPEVGFPLQPIFCGTYHDTFKRNEEGKWYYATHRLVEDMMGETCNHRVDFSDSSWDADEEHPDRVS